MSQRLATGVILAVFVQFTVGIWYEVIWGVRDPKFLELFLPVVGCTVAALLVIRAFRNSVRLSPQTIELRSLAGVRILPFEKIKGRRRYVSTGDENSPTVAHLVLEPNDDRFRKLDIEELYRFDDEFYAWFNSLPDLDELDKARPKQSNFGLV